MESEKPEGLTVKRSRGEEKGFGGMVMDEC